MNSAFMLRLDYTHDTSIREVAYKQGASLWNVVFGSTVVFSRTVALCSEVSVL